MKRTLKIFGILILILILFRGCIYRNTINYGEIGVREEVELTNQELLNKIKSKSANRNIDLKEIINIANSITNEELSFTKNQVSDNPNELINTNRANCIGYSAFFNSIANYLIRQNDLENEMVAKHHVGLLDFMGINLHQFFDDPFFKDHDFNTIENLVSGEIVSIDPSVSDYLMIERVTKR